MYIIVSVIQERPCHSDVAHIVILMPPYLVILNGAAGEVKDLLHWSALSSSSQRRTW